MRQERRKARPGENQVCNGKISGKKKGGYQYRIGVYRLRGAFGLSPSPPARVALIKLSQVKPKKRNMKMFPFDAAKWPQQVRFWHGVSDPNGI